MNETIRIIKQRRSIRRFQKQQITENELNEIVEAGRYAPSGGNNQTTHLIVIQKAELLEELRTLVEQEFSSMELTDQLYKSLKNSILASRKGNYHFHYDAPTLIIAANRIGYANAIADSACAIENMMLAATSLGVGSCWINQLHWLDDNPVIQKRMRSIGLKEDETICGGLALGYPSEVIEKLEPLRRTGNPVTMVQ